MQINLTEKIKAISEIKDGQDLDIKEFFLSESQMNEIRKILLYVTDLFDQHNIFYCIDGGTLLGCCRNGGQIPWDDDSDLMVLEKDFPKIIELFDQIKKDGFEPMFTENMIKIMNGNPVDSKYGFVGRPCCDLFSWKYNKKKDLYRLAVPTFRKRWPACQYKSKDLLPLRPYSYDGKILKGPNNPLYYLDGMYPKWQFKACIDVRLPMGKVVSMEFDIISNDTVNDK